MTTEPETGRSPSRRDSALPLATAPLATATSASTHAPGLAVIVGSTREGRAGPAFAEWFRDQAWNHGRFRIDLIDLADAKIPSVYPAHPDSPVREYIRRLADADAFVIVTPEYNHGYPGTLKQAIDLARSEWHAKPVGFVSYGGVAGGLRAVEQLRPVFAELHAVTVRDGVSFRNYWETFDVATRMPRADDGCNAAAIKMLDQLLWWSVALRDARSQRPYVA